MMKWLVPPVLFFACVAAMASSIYLAHGHALVPPPYNWIGVLLVAAGLALGVIGAATFRRVRTNINTFKNPDVLVTSGVFAISRNPMYLGFVLALFGAALIFNGTTALAIAAAFFLVAALWYVPFEEARMKAVFGEQFDAYRRKTRRWI
jgi:protein-S-isoprenylcysteine O-methyltransferase Ste14